MVSGSNTHALVSLSFDGGRAVLHRDTGLLTESLVLSESMSTLLAQRCAARLEPGFAAALWPVVLSAEAQLVTDRRTRRNTLN